MILITNIADVGHFDANILKKQIENECSRFGNIEKIVLYEDKHPNVPPSEVVRIFVKFSELVSSSRAIAELETIGTRTIKCVFYDQQLFTGNDFDY